MSDRDTVLVVGLGNFGQTVAKHALQSGHKLKLYLRPQSIEKRKQQIDELKKLGSVELIEGTLEETDIDKLRDVVKNVDVIVCAISVENMQDNDETIYKNYMKEANLIKATEGVKLKRYIPNEWGIPCNPELGPLFVAKAEIHKILKSSGIPYTPIYVGWLTEMAPYWTGAVFGSGDTKITFTTLDDIGRIAVKSIFDERTKNKSFYIHGDKVTQKEIFQILGKDINSVPKLTNEDLNKRKEEKKKSNIMTALEAYIQGFIFEPIEDPNTVHSGDLYPNDKLTKLKEYKESSAKFVSDFVYQ